METTGYCGCQECCEWQRGSWAFLKLNFWDRYISKGKNKGGDYSGKTASGAEPQEVYAGLFSVDSMTNPWKIPFRVVLPWLWLSEYGTIAADTHYYPFGTKIKIPGYGWGEVTDRGGAIKGPNRLDLYFASHQDALRWGRRSLQVRIKR
ncbi:MAG: 3D domain-containing protein [Proteobacteria bacterium]|nr:3D domain-containing protein [Pseudomonadota bacterium]MBU1641041.1 3D domain-containing protein [Pseudomonadota bacterium]